MGREARGRPWPAGGEGRGEACRRHRQSGEEFERAGGERERGLLLFGAPGTGKTMLAKAIATGFNSPFISMPGSGFAATFVGIDAIIVRLLARRARSSLASGVASASSSSTRSTPSGCDDSRFDGLPGVHPAHRGSGRGGDPLLRPLGLPRSLGRPDRREPRLARAPRSRSARPSRYPRSERDVRPPEPVLRLHVPGWDGRNGRRARAQPAARRDGRHRQPAVHARGRSRASSTPSSTRASSSRGGSAR